MGDPGHENTKPARPVSYLSRSVMAVVCLLAAIVCGLLVYLATPLAARHVSRLLTSYLHQNISIDKMRTTGAGLYLRGVRLDNPTGFSKGRLVAADSLVIAPNWGELLRGRRSFRLVSLQGISISLERNSSGTWNFTQLQQLLASKKGPPVETYIKELSIKEGSLRVNGQGAQGIALQIFNLSSKGSLDSKIDLAFLDAAGNRYTLSGQGRGGTDPTFDLSLQAPALSLPGLAATMGLKKQELLAGGTGSLQLNAGLHKGDLSAAGNLNFSHLRYSTAKRTFPVAGKLEFAAEYSLPRDAAFLKTCRLTINDLVQVSAKGTLQDLKKERHFSLDLAFNEVDLGPLNALVPTQARRDLVVGGVLSGRELHLAGNRSKLTGASGTLQLRDGTLAKGGRPLFSGLAGSVGFSRAGDGMLAKGRLQVSAARDKALLEGLDMPFSLSASRQMKLLQAEIPALSARVLGIPFSGRVGFDAAKGSPLSASLKMPPSRVTALQQFLQPYGVTAHSGSASVALELTGKNLQQLDATLGVQLADFQGTRGKEAIAIKKADVSAKVSRGGGHLLVKGDASLQGLAYAGKAGDARFTYQVADNVVRLDGAQLNLAGAQVSIARLSGVLPVRGSAGNTAGLPLSLDFDGCSVKRGDLQLSSLSGRLRGNLQGGPAGRWLEGNAEIAAGRLAWQGKPVAAPVVRIAFSKSGAKGELNGKLLGGALTGTVSGNPFATEAGAGFELGLKDAELAAVAPFLPKGSAAHPTDGLVELQLSGAYSRPSGLSWRLDSKGARVALARTGGKALVSGGAFSLAGEMAGDTLSVSRLLLSPGQGVVLELKGSLAHPFSEQRAGRLSFSLPETPASGMVDPLINLLPKAILEASIDGTLAGSGTLDLGQGKKLLEGSLVFKGGRFELAGQKLAVSAINGRFPYSLDLSGKALGKPQVAMAFSRENYPALLTQLRQGKGAGETVTIGKISFGPLEMGALTMRATAGNGMTEIVSLQSTLYEGALLGRGYLTMRGGLSYRGDLLINGLSLKQLCSIFPGIQGYISGRVDGVVSMSGGSHGLAGLSGFTQLWAREGGGEKMLVSKEFLQRLAKQKLGGFFFRSDRRYDQAEIKALMEEGYLSFETLKIVHTNLFGVRDLNVSIAPTQNRIALNHLLESVQQAATRGKASTGGAAPGTGETPGAGEPAPEAPVQEFKWGE
jgi:hypothetical protein